MGTLTNAFEQYQSLGNVQNWDEDDLFMGQFYLHQEITFTSPYENHYNDLCRLYNQVCDEIYSRGLYDNR